MKMGSKLIAIAVLALAGSSAARAACHVITPSGSGTHSGADWNNAMAGMPGSFIRGDSYYLGPGNYGSWTGTQGASVSLAITIKRAFISDHCTNTGYNETTMGQSAGQAVFTRMETDTDWWIVDGNYPGAKPAVRTQTGIFIDGSGCTTSNCWNFSLPNGTANITIRNLSILGGQDINTDTKTDTNIRIIGGGPVLIQYVMVDHSNNTPLLLRN